MRKYHSSASLRTVFHRYFYVCLCTSVRSHTTVWYWTLLQPESSYAKLFYALLHCTVLSSPMIQFWVSHCLWQHVTSGPFSSSYNSFLLSPLPTLTHYNPPPPLSPCNRPLPSLAPLLPPPPPLLTPPLHILLILLLSSGMIENSGFPDQTYDIWTATGVHSYCGVRVE